MTRTRHVVIALFVCVSSGSLALAAQRLAAADGWVVLPVDEYRALRDRANPPAPQPPASPVDATLTRVDYDLRVEPDAIVGRALLTIDVIRDGWTRVQIPPGLMVRDAQHDGRPVSLIEGPPPHVLLSRTGRVALTLDIVLPLGASTGSESITLPASASPITRATLTLPRGGVELSVSGGLISDRAESPSETRLTAFGRPGQPLTLSWKRRVDDRRAGQPLRTRARITSLVGLGEEVTQITVAVRVEVLEGIARDVVLAIPAGVVVNQVNGATVAEWNLVDGALMVRLLDPVSTEASFVVQAETRTPREGPLAVPLIRVPAAQRESGGIAVDVVGAGEIGERQARGLDPADVTELGEIVTGRESPSMLAFRLKPIAGSEPRSLNVTVVRYTPQAVLIANVEEARYRVLASEDGRLLVEGRYAVRNNQRSFLKVTLPPETTLWSARLAGRPVRPGVAEANAVLLPLEKGFAGEEAPIFVVELMYLQRIDGWPRNGRARIDLPALDLPVSRTGIQFSYPPRFRVTLAAGAFRVENDPGPIAVALRSSASIPSFNVSVDMHAPDKMQALVDEFRKESGGRVVGSLPVDITFPEFGPSVFFATELGAESRAPFVEVVFKRIG
jgi:hypothetical protein